jgi:hypothetical protein
MGERNERPVHGRSGFKVSVAIRADGRGVALAHSSTRQFSDFGPPNALDVRLVLTFIVMIKGVYILQPNQSTLLMLFGSYRGMTIPPACAGRTRSTTRRKSAALRNFNSEKLKVNDKRGNPIEIAAAIVWKVSDTARAVLDIDHYEQYVPIQAEALRHLPVYSYGHVEDEEGALTPRWRHGHRQTQGRTTAALREGRPACRRRVLTHRLRAEIAGAMLRASRLLIGAAIVMGAVSRRWSRASPSVASSSRRRAQGHGVELVSLAQNPKRSPSSIPVRLLQAVAERAPSARRSAALDPAVAAAIGHSPPGAAQRRSDRMVAARISGQARACHRHHRTNARGSAEE